MKRKNLAIKNATDSKIQATVQKGQSQPKPEGKKLGLERPENGTQQKIVFSQPSNLNVLKAENYLPKNNTTFSKKNELP